MNPSIRTNLCVSEAEHLTLTPFVLGRLVAIGRIKLTRPLRGKPYIAPDAIEAYLRSLEIHRTRSRRTRSAKATYKRTKRFDMPKSRTVDSHQPSSSPLKVLPLEQLRNI